MYTGVGVGNIYKDPQRHLKTDTNTTALVFEYFFLGWKVFFFRLGLILLIYFYCSKEYRIIS